MINDFDYSVRCFNISLVLRFGQIWRQLLSSTQEPQRAAMAEGENATTPSPTRRNPSSGMLARTRGSIDGSTV